MLQFDSARWMQDSGGVWLCLRATAPAAAKEFCGTMQPKLYDADLKVHREKRSLDANAYCWVLIGKLAAKLRVTPEEVYRSYIPDVAGNYEVVPVRDDKISAWEKLWCSGHIGRMIEDIGPCRNAVGYHNIRSFIGSSDYDTCQMNRLIQLVVQDCKEQEIDVMTPKEIQLLTQEWGDKNF